MTAAGGFFHGLSMLLCLTSGYALGQGNESVAGFILLWAFAAAIIGFILSDFGGR